MSGIFVNCPDNALRVYHVTKKNFPKVGEGDALGFHKKKFICYGDRSIVSFYGGSVHLFYIPWAVCTFHLVLCVTLSEVPVAIHSLGANAPRWKLNLGSSTPPCSFHNACLWLWDTENLTAVDIKNDSVAVHSCPNVCYYGPHLLLTACQGISIYSN